MDIFEKAEARISELEPVVAQSQKEIDDLKGLVSAGRAAKKVQEQAEESLLKLLGGKIPHENTNPMCGEIGAGVIIPQVHDPIKNESAHLLAADVPMRADDMPKALKPLENPSKSNVRTAKERVADVFKGNPNLSVAEIAKKAGVPKNTTQAYVSAIKREAREKAGKVQKVDQSASTSQQLRPKTSNGATCRPRYPVEPKRTGTHFRLLDRETKKFLHCDLNAMSKGRLNFTNDKLYAWCGTEQQMLAVRKMLPATIDCIEQVVDQ